MNDDLVMLDEEDMSDGRVYFVIRKEWDVNGSLVSLTKKEAFALAMNILTQVDIG